jgi:alkylation response protein AidB-like acyl-CoA dehydrogenase
MKTNAAWDKAWGDIESLRPIIEAYRDHAENLRHLPDVLAEAFIERDLYRLMLPEDLGGAGIDPIQHFDLTLQISRYDGSTGWLYWLAGGAANLAGRAPPEVSRKLFATPDCGAAASGQPAGRAFATAGGYRVSGRWAWASGINQARHVAGNCILFEGDKPLAAPHGGPTVLMALAPIEDVRVLDTWHTGGMRGTGSTEFVMEDLFIPSERAFPMFGPPTHPHPLFKLPPSYFGFGLVAVALGIAYSTVGALKELAHAKKLPPPRSVLADQASVQFAVAKSEALVEAAHVSARDAGVRLWDEVCTNGEARMDTRTRLRRALVHAVDSCIEAISLCYREAGGSAVYRSAPFERALRDIYTIGGHAVVQRSMMEDAGRAALGLKPLSPMF